MLVCGVVLVGRVSCTQPTSEKKVAKAPQKAAPVDRRTPFGEGRIEGQVQFLGRPPPPDPIRFDLLGGECEPLMANPESKEVDVSEDGGLRHVFVYVYSGLPATATYPVPQEPLVIKNLNCWFVPKIAGIRVGQTLEMQNSDNIVHNFHGHLKSSEFNLSMTKRGMTIKRVFKRPEVMVLLLCDIHPWMHSFVGVLAHPFFATTSDSGAFKIERLPPGAYKLQVWHRLLGTKMVDVQIPESGAPQKLSVQFGEKDLPAPGMRPPIQNSYGRLGWKTQGEDR